MAAVYTLNGPLQLVLKQQPLDHVTERPGLVEANTIVSVISPGTEVAAYVGQPPLRPGPQYPRVVGYCNVAEISAVSENVLDLVPGDRILTFESHRSAFCCPAEKIVAAIAPDMEPAEAASAYLFHLGYQSLLQCGARPGMKIGIIGLGTIGLAAVAVASDLGFSTAAFSAQPDLRAQAKAFGAGCVVDKGDVGLDTSAAWAGETGIDIVILMSNVWPDWLFALKLVRFGGTIGLLGFPGRGEPAPDFNPLDSRYIYDKQLLVRGCGHPMEINAAPHEARFTVKRNMRFLLERIAAGNLPAGKLISARVESSELGHVYKQLAARKPNLITAALIWRQAG